MKIFEKLKKSKETYSSEIYLKDENQYSEFEIQCLVYFILKSHYPYVKGEFKIKGARFDIAIFDSTRKLILIVEVKKSEYSHSTSQKDKYEYLTGVPCIYIRGIENALDSYKIVKNFLGY